MELNGKGGKLTEFMKWIVVYDREGNAKGYECNRCGFYTRQKLLGCPFCKRQSMGEEK